MSDYEDAARTLGCGLFVAGIIVGACLVFIATVVLGWL